MSGLFITIDSLDGIGKTTLVRGLAAHLGGFAMDTPGAPLRELSTPILHAFGNSETAKCLFYAASVLAQGERARALAARGEIVVMDRYWASTLAYARARGVTIDLSAIAALVPAPDLSILLTLDEGERVRRLALRGGISPADAETLSVEFRNTVMHHLRQGTNVEIDLTGTDPEAAVRRVAELVNLRIS